MKQYFVIGATALFLLSSCGNSKKDETAILNDKKAALEKLKGEKAKTDEEIKKMETELARLDTAAANAAKFKLVSIAPVTTQNFQHFIDLQGKVDADNISYISPRGMAGQVKAIFVKEGDFVKKGQLLLKMDDAIIRQQLEGIKTQLNFAKNIYQRQKNLWDQGIGTEVQLISAKNNVESLESQLKSGEEQLKTADVYSDVTGVADIMNVRLGETFTGMSSTGPQIKIVNTSSLKVVTDVPENYASRIHKGSEVNVLVPDANKNIKSVISLISQSIDPSKRGFIAEAKIPYDAYLKPNQLAVMKIMDYAAPNAVVIPVNVVQSDEKGKYVYVMEKLSNGRSVAKKKIIIIGEVNGEWVEVKTGLSAGEQLITEAYQNLYEGQQVSTEVK